jgi:hypothetical protein
MPVFDASGKPPAAGVGVSLAVGVGIESWAVHPERLAHSEIRDRVTIANPV